MTSQQHSDDVDVEHIQKTIYITDATQIPKSQLELDEEIGRGGFGTVWSAKWNGLPVAVKVCEQTQFVDDFYKEAEILQNLHHHTIVKFIGIAEISISIEGKQLMKTCIVTELMEDGSLYRVLHQSPNIVISHDDIISWSIQIALGIDYFHSRNILHRDIKSEKLLQYTFTNRHIDVFSILLKDNRQTVKIADFGIARKMSTRTTTARKQRGTMPYMAPEVIAGQTYRRSSDVYSFGILLCEMINRSLPYADLNDYQIMFGVSSNNLRPNIDDNVPEHMRSLIIKCWNFDPTQRPNITNIVSEVLRWRLATTFDLSLDEIPPEPTPPTREEEEEAELVVTTNSIEIQPDLQPIPIVIDSMSETLVVGSISNEKAATETSRLSELNEIDLRTIAEEETTSENDRIEALIRLLSLWPSNISEEQFEFIRNIIDISNRQLDNSFYITEISQSYENRLRLFDSIVIDCDRCQHGDVPLFYTQLLHRCFHRHSAIIVDQRQLTHRIYRLIDEQMQLILSDVIWLNASWSMYSYKFDILHFFAPLLAAYQTEITNRNKLQLFKKRFEEIEKVDPNDWRLQEILRHIKQIEQIM